MDIRRGLFAAAWCAILGALVPASIAAAYAGFRWLNPTFVPAIGIHDFLSDLVEYWIFPVCGGAVFFGCAAWAIFAPPGSWRFVTSLFVIFGATVAAWFVIGFLDDWLRLGWLKMYKTDDPHVPRLSQALVLFGLPLAVAQSLALLRQWRSSPQDTSANR